MIKKQSVVIAWLTLYEDGTKTKLHFPCCRFCNYLIISLKMLKYMDFTTIIQYPTHNKVFVFVSQRNIFKINYRKIIKLFKFLYIQCKSESVYTAYSNHIMAPGNTIGILANKLK